MKIIVFIILGPALQTLYFFQSSFFLYTNSQSLQGSQIPSTQCTRSNLSDPVCGSTGMKEANKVAAVKRNERRKYRFF
uniref:Secreted protein n=1 Tax=Amphilophus citrinellus TaxID=61819 RepID=A0A3Q0SIX4_AMPCI